MVQNCLALNLSMAMFELRIQIDPAILKFLTWHLHKEGEFLVLTKKNYFGALILSKLSKATIEDIKENMEGNLRISFPARHKPELEISLHQGGAVAIKKEQQREINNFFKSFMMHIIGLEIDAEQGNIKDRITKVREKYGITDEEISFDAFKKSHYRYRTQYNKKLSDKYNNRD